MLLGVCPPLTPPPSHPRPTARTHASAGRTNSSILAGSANNSQLNADGMGIHKWSWCHIFVKREESPEMAAEAIYLCRGPSIYMYIRGPGQCNVYSCAAQPSIKEICPGPGQCNNVSLCEPRTPQWRLAAWSYTPHQLAQTEHSLYICFVRAEKLLQ